MQLSAEQLRELASMADAWLNADEAERTRLRAVSAANGADFDRAFGAMVAQLTSTDAPTVLPHIPGAMRDAALAASLERDSDAVASDLPVAAGAQADARVDDEATFTAFGRNLPSPERASGQRIGPYRLIKELGRGGMGVVWLAERADGQHSRQVALKMPLVENLNWLLAARFARERNILASLEHPGIARLYDAGVDQATQPYIAIEYVHGQPITDYVKEKRLKPEATAQLFIRVIEAVAHAHTQLVIHRDIKPSNILVDAKGEPHLLDFGIAKLLDDEDSPTADATQLTRLSGRALTLDYASPEQVNNASLGTASDVYSLGVVLYELLTGRRPYDPKGPTRRDLEQAILDQDPAKPSDQRLITGDSESGKSARRIRGDLDTVVLKALRKDPKQRYATAQAFADDLKRYLAYEPIAAKPDAGWYRVGRFVRRHRVGVVAGVLVLLTFFGGFASTLHQADLARKQAQRAETVRDFVEGIFSPFSEGVVEAKQPSLADLLRTSVSNLQKNDTLAVEERIDLLSIFSRLSNKVEKRDQALTLIDEAYRLSVTRFGANHESTAIALAARGHQYLTMGKRELAEADLTSAETLFRKHRIHGEVLIRLYTALSQLASQRKSADDALRYAQLGLEERIAFHKPESPSIATGYSNLGYGLESVGRYGDAAAAYDKANQLFLKNYRPDSYETAISLSQRGNARALAGRLNEGIADLKAAQNAFVLHPSRSGRQWLNLSRLCAYTALTQAAHSAHQMCALAQQFTLQTAGSGSEDDALVNRMLAGLALEEGDFISTRRHLDFAAPILSRKGVPAWSATATLTYGELAFREGRMQDASRLLSDGLKLLGDGFPPHLRRNGLALLALICDERRDDASCPHDVFVVAVNAIDEASYRDSALVLPAHVALARVDLNHGRASDAARRLARINDAVVDQVDTQRPRFVEARLWQAAAQAVAGNCDEGKRIIKAQSRVLDAAPLQSGAIWEAAFRAATIASAGC